jgi:hypothetical protein
MFESAVGVSTDTPPRVSTDTPPLPPSRPADGVATSTLCERALVFVADASVLLFASCVACHVKAIGVRSEGGGHASPFRYRV